MNKSLSPVQFSMMLDAGYSHDEVSEMVMCKCGDAEAVAVYSVKGVDLCGACYESGLPTFLE